MIDLSCAVHLNGCETENHRQGRLMDPFGAHSAGIRGYDDLRVSLLFVRNSSASKHRVEALTSCNIVSKAIFDGLTSCPWSLIMEILSQQHINAPNS